MLTQDETAPRLPRAAHYDISRRGLGGANIDKADRSRRSQDPCERPAYTGKGSTVDLVSGCAVDREMRDIFRPKPGSAVWSLQVLAGQKARDLGSRADRNSMIAVSAMCWIAGLSLGVFAASPPIHDLWVSSISILGTESSSPPSSHGSLTLPLSTAVPPERLKPRSSGNYGILPYAYSSRSAAYAPGSRSNHNRRTDVPQIAALPAQRRAPVLVSSASDFAAPCHEADPNTRADCVGQILYDLQEAFTADLTQAGQSGIDEATLAQFGEHATQLRLMGRLEPSAAVIGYRSLRESLDKVITGSAIRKPGTSVELKSNVAPYP